MRRARESAVDNQKKLFTLTSTVENQMRDAVKLLFLSSIVSVLLTAPAVTQTQKLQILPAVRTNCGGPSGSPTLGWTWFCSISQLFLFDRQGSGLYSCSGGAFVKWAPNKTVIKNDLNINCSLINKAFPNANGDYDAMVLSELPPTPPAGKLFWFVANQQDKKFALCFSGSTGGGALPLLQINKCESTTLP
jgi:hypothetical protein